MSESNVNEPTHKPIYWRSLQDLDRADDFVAQHKDEFPSGTFDPAPEPQQESNGNLNRRNFLGIMGASLALASGAGSLSGCIRKNQQHILPYTDRPEHLLPGVPSYFRTAFHVGGHVQGLHVESQDLRPTKVDGNPDHPMNNPFNEEVNPRNRRHRLGASSVWAQSSILDLYDPDRSKTVLPSSPSAWADLSAAIQTTLASHKDGSKLAFIFESAPSPTLERLLASLKATFPNARFFSHDLAANTNEQTALDALLGPSRKPIYQLHRASSIVSFDSDFLGVEGDVVRNARLFADGRRSPEKGEMNRLYFAGPALNVTSAMADEQLRIPSSQVGLVLAAVTRAVLKKTKNDALFGPITQILSKLPEPTIPAPNKAGWVEAVAEELTAQKKKNTIVLAGYRQPPWVHGLALLLNQALGNLGTTIQIFDHSLNGQSPRPLFEPLSALKTGDIDAAFIFGGNPIHTSPNFKDALQGATSFHLSSHVDETSSASSWHIPRSHFLEAWGDWRASDGTTSLQQPLIAPIHNTLSDVELLSALAASPDQRAQAFAAIQDPSLRDYGFAAVRATWGSLDDQKWRETLFKGLLLQQDIQALRNKEMRPIPQLAAALDSQQPKWGATTLFSATPTDFPLPSSDALEVNFSLSPAVCDGRFANNAWLQELPDPISKLTWGNAAYLSVATSKALNVTSRPHGRDHVGDWVSLEVNGKACELPVMIIPGMADNVAVVHLGYGRKNAGKVALQENATGTDVFPLLAPQNPWFSAGAKISPKGKTFPVATTQDHWHLDTGFKRPIIQEYRFDEPELFNPSTSDQKAHAELATYKNENYQSILFGKSLIFDDKQSTYTKRTLETFNGQKSVAVVQQWGMVIDLNTCTGCNVCVIACQAENNIPVVGKDRVLNGREMHWMRIDRYYRGEDAANPDTIVVQPLACAHCETAPCETVCPVAATVHSPEGTNDMVYNRCIGTRYCSNNCPYKVRRYNFFNYQKENDENNPMMKLQKNPDVSIRFRGVMEKCTYCIQRIMQAKSTFKRAGEPIVPDGGVITACAQACPSNAIIFGDVKDTSNTAERSSLVSSLKSLFRNYAVLAELNIHPRTTYLARLRNRDARLTPKPAPDAHAGGHH
jgi:MoCo/4Fe-4S cofactor protein with predicted Tat translocation signal